MTSEIIFCKLNEPYGEFSNFYPSSMTIDGKKYKTVEHYYQSMKFKDTEFEDIVRTQLSPMKCKKMAYDPPGAKFFIGNWDDIKIDVMHKALQHKFKISTFKNLLLSTESVNIVEFSTKDYFWGRSEDGYGSNVLGELLMIVRDEIILNDKKKGMFL